MNANVDTMNQDQDKKQGRKRAVVALGALLGIAAVATGAAFTDFANLNLGADGLGSSDTYNIQVVGTDPTTGEILAGTWQEANTAAGVPIAIDRANAIFPGSEYVSVEIPVRNASTAISSSLSLKLAKLADTVENVTDPGYLAALRFEVSMPRTARNNSSITLSQQTFADLSSGITLNELEGLEESSITISIDLPDSADPEVNAALNGKQAFLQTQFNGTSID